MIKLNLVLFKAAKNFVCQYQLRVLTDFVFSIVQLLASLFRQLDDLCVNVALLSLED